MALPVTIVSDVGLPGHHPPAKSSGGAFYAVVRADADELDVYKATDPTDTFSVQDSGNGPVHLDATILGYAVHQDGDVLHIVAWGATTYEYYTFNMATDLWALDELIITLGGQNVASFPWAAIDVRTDGDVIVGYAGERDNVMGIRRERVDYTRREGGTWMAGIALDAGGEVMYGNPSLVWEPSTTRMQIAWQTTSSATSPPTAWTDTEARSLRNDNTLGAVATGTVDSGGAMLGMQNMVLSGVGFAIMPDDGTEINGVKLQSTVDDDVNLVLAGFPLAADPFVNGEVGIATIALETASGDIHLLFSGGGVAGVDQDLFYAVSSNGGADFGTEVEEIDAVTINFVSAAVYDRSGTKLAYLYDDGGVQKYGEKELAAVIDLAAGLPITATVAAALTGDGTLAAAPSIAVIIAAALEGVGSLEAANQIALTIAADIQAGEDLQAALPITATVAAALEATGTLTAAQSLILSVAADLSGEGKLDAALALVLTVAADLRGSGSLAAANNLTLSVAADLDGLGSLSAAASIALTVAAGLNAAGSLEAANSIIVTVVADIQSGSANDLAAALQLTLTAAPALDGAGTLAAALAIVLSATPNLNAVGTLAAAPALTLSAVADLQAQGSLDAALALVLQLVADLDATGTLAATPSIALTVAAALTAQGELNAALAIAVTVAADVTSGSANDLDAALQLSLTVSPALTGSGALISTPPISLTVIPGLTAQGTLDAALALALTVVPDLDATGRLEAALLISALVTANCEGAGELSAALPIVINVSADLRAPGALAAAPSIILSIAPTLSAPGTLDAALLLQLLVAANIVDGSARRIPNSIQDILASLLNSEQNLLGGGNSSGVLSG